MEVYHFLFFSSISFTSYERWILIISYLRSSRIHDLWQHDRTKYFHNGRQENIILQVLSFENFYLWTINSPPPGFVWSLLYGVLKCKFANINKMKNRVKQDLVFSVKLHLGLIPWPLSLMSCALSLNPLYCSFKEI